MREIYLSSGLKLSFLKALSHISEIFHTCGLAPKELLLDIMAERVLPLRVLQDPQ